MSLQTNPCQCLRVQLLGGTAPHPTLHGMGLAPQYHRTDQYNGYELQERARKLKVGPCGCCFSFSRNFHLSVSTGWRGRAGGSQEPICAALQHL